MTLTLPFVCLCVRRFRWFGFGQVGGEGEVTSLGEAEARDDLREIIRDLKQVNLASFLRRLVAWFGLVWLVWFVRLALL